MVENKNIAMCRERINKIAEIISETITNISYTEESFTYAEINAALIQILKQNSDIALKSLWW